MSNPARDPLASVGGPMSIETIPVPKPGPTDAPIEVEVIVP
jgi:hypothetical protein